MAHLSSIHTRVDPLFNDINNNIKANDDTSVRETLLQALRGCIKNGGHKMGEKIRNEILDTLLDQLVSEEESISGSAAGCLGCLCSHLEADQVTDLVQNQMLDSTSDSWAVRKGHSSFLAVALKESCTAVLSDDFESQILSNVAALASLDRVHLAVNGVHAAAYLLHRYASTTPQNAPSQIIAALKKSLEHTSNDVKIECSRSLTWLMQNVDGSTKKENGAHENGDDTPAGYVVPKEYLSSLISSLLTVSREKNTTVRSSAESAIVSLLKLRHTTTYLENVCTSLAQRDVTTLQDLQKNKLTRILSQEVSEEIDTTVIRS